MLLRRNLRILFFVALFFVGSVTYLVHLYYTTETVVKTPRRLYKNFSNKNRVFEQDLMTEEPENDAKLRDYERQMWQRIHNQTAQQNEQQRKRVRMDHDPLGVVIKQPALPWESVSNAGQTTAPVHDAIGQPNVARQQQDIDELQQNTLVAGRRSAVRPNSALTNVLHHKIVHLDLKGAPPKLSYLKQLFPLLKSYGATGLLIEYEDMFPYWGPLAQLAAHNAYPKGDIGELLESARSNGLEVIPLLQTFGHLEWVLKLRQFSHLREVPNYPQVICPSHNETWTLITTMIDQVMSLHNGLNWFHIGADEVYNLAECARCQASLATLGGPAGKHEIFLAHVARVARYVRGTYDTQPIVWDDEFRRLPEASIRHSGINSLVEIMVWKYSGSILADVTGDVWEKYGSLFPGVWIATAYKGASQPDTMLTDINERLANHKEWMEVFDMYKNSVPFRGIALTGWSRYDHFAVLCELLPQALPSLAVDLMFLTTRKADHKALTAVGEALGCVGFLPLDLQYLDGPPVKCTFPGADIYQITQRLFLLHRDTETMLRSPHVTGWITPYHLAQSFASPQHLDRGLQDLPMLTFEYERVAVDAANALRQIYDEHTVNEWIAQNLTPALQKLRELLEAVKILGLKREWSRRPLDVPEVHEL